MRSRLGSGHSGSPILVGLGLTAGLQLVVAMASGSLAVLADTIQLRRCLDGHSHGYGSVDDPPASHTYGYGRAEDLAGLFVLLMIIISALIAA
jgi:divalent metal cation (Fe/Co/Zn/Cd) transporter